MNRPSLLLFCLAVAGCRSEAAPHPKGRSWPTAPEATSESPVAKKLPRVAYRGGPFLANPRVVTVTWRSDEPALVARLEQFGDGITKTSWWRAVVDSYCTKEGRCIGEGSGGAHVHVGDAAPASIDDIDLLAVVERQVGALPPDSVVLVYPPAGTAVTDAFASYCKGGPRAYHRASKRWPYAVMPRCSDENELTAAASHELVEAVTNPDPGAHGFAFERGSATLGFTYAGIEPVDPCGAITMDQHWTTAGGFAVQRAWSNREAALGHDPCVPSRPDRPYLALVPREPAVRLGKVGDSATVVVDAVADREVPPWSVSAFDLTGFQEHAALVDVSFDRASIRAGESATLTITLRKINDGRLGIVGAISSLGVQSWMWPIPVVMR